MILLEQLKIAGCKNDEDYTSTKEEIETALAESIAADKTAEREAAAADIQAYIDADAKLSAAGFVASADALDEVWVVVTFPTDAGLPAFYAAAASEIVQTHGGKYVTAPYVVRQSKAKWISHLNRIASAL